MNIIILGAAGFIGTNLAIELTKDTNNNLTLVDSNKEYFRHIEKMQLSNIIIKESLLLDEEEIDSLFKNQDILYYLISTTVPTTSNKCIPQELEANVIFAANIFEACVRCGVKKVVFISSGGTVYGKEVDCPLSEETPTYPISAYGIQKVTIEKLLYLYNHMHGVDYRIIRLANPYGPYQRPNGVLGAVTTFTYKALKGDEIVVYGDGTVIRDFIYIEDAVKAIIRIANEESKYHTFNLGCGYGTSINELLDTIRKTLNIRINVIYKSGRKVDVPINYLDISRYEKCYGKLNPLSLTEGITKTAQFMKEYFLHDFER